MKRLLKSCTLVCFLLLACLGLQSCDPNEILGGIDPGDLVGTWECVSYTTKDPELGVTPFDNPWNLTAPSIFVANGMRYEFSKSKWRRYYLNQDTGQWEEDNESNGTYKVTIKKLKLTYNAGTNDETYWNYEVEKLTDDELVLKYEFDFIDIYKNTYTGHFKRVK